MFGPGTTNCSGPVPGGNVIYDSPDDKLNAVPGLIRGNTSGQTFPSFDEDGSIYPNGNDTTLNPDGKTYTEGPTELAGYYPGTTTPRPLLASALDYVDAQLAAMDAAIQANPDTAGSTAIIITAEHGSARCTPAARRSPRLPGIGRGHDRW